MFSRSVGILIGAWLPMLAVTLPIGPVHTANALIAGILATVLSLAALADDRAGSAPPSSGPGWPCRPSFSPRRCSRRC